MALIDNIIAFWKLGEADGASRLDSVGSNNLADNATVTQIGGKIGNAAHFAQASSQFLSIADNTDLSTGDIDFTFACWVWIDSKVGADMQIVSKWKTAGALREWVLQWVGGGTDRYRFIVSGLTEAISTVDANNFGVPPTGAWHFIVCWHDATANTINIQVNNGSINSTAHTDGVRDAAASFVIGTLDEAASFWNGRVDAAGFWKKVLPSGEKTELWNGGAGLEYPFTALLPVIQSRISMAQP